MVIGSGGVYGVIANALAIMHESVGVVLMVRRRAPNDAEHG